MKTLIVLCGICAALSCSPVDAGLFGRFMRRPACAACQKPAAKVESKAGAAAPKYVYKCENGVCRKIQVK